MLTPIERAARRKVAVASLAPAIELLDDQGAMIDDLLALLRDVDTALFRTEMQIPVDLEALRDRVLKALGNAVD